MCVAFMYRDSKKVPLHLCKNSAAVCGKWESHLHKKLRPGGGGAYVTSVTYSEFPPTTHSQRSTLISFSVTYVVGNILLPTGKGTSRSLCVSNET